MHAERYQLLRKLYGNHAPSQDMCEGWFRSFKNGDFGKGRFNSDQSGHFLMILGEMGRQRRTIHIDQKSETLWHKDGVLYSVLKLGVAVNTSHYQQ